MEEKPATPDTEAWREAEDGRRMMLVITDAGLRATDGGPGGEAAKKPVAKNRHVKKRRGGAARKPAAAKSTSKPC